MSQVLNELHYASSHEWVRLDGDNTATIGISDFAQSQLGDLVFVDLPEVGDTLHAGDEAAVVESVKTASDVYSPLSGEVIEINDALEGEPAAVNAEPYTDGWLYRIKLQDDTEIDSLLSADDYSQQIENE